MVEEKLISKGAVTTFGWSSDRFDKIVWPACRISVVGGPMFRERSAHRAHNPVGLTT